MGVKLDFSTLANCQVRIISPGSFYARAEPECLIKGLGYLPKRRPSFSEEERRLRAWLGGRHSPA